MSFSRGSSRPRDRTQVSCIAGRFFTVWATREAWEKRKPMQIDKKEDRRQERAQEASPPRQEQTILLSGRLLSFLPRRGLWLGTLLHLPCNPFSISLGVERFLVPVSRLGASPRPDCHQPLPLYVGPQETACWPLGAEPPPLFALLSCCSWWMTL